MPNLFGVNMAAEIARGLGNKLLPAILTKMTETTRTTGSLTAGTNPLTTDYPCRGFIEDYSDYDLANTIIQTSDRKITILGGTLPVNIVPMNGDKITIENTLYTIIRVKRDPAGATYTLQSRG